MTECLERVPSEQARRMRTEELIKSIVPPSEEQFLRDVRPAQWSAHLNLPRQLCLGGQHHPSIPERVNASGRECYTIFSNTCG